MTPEIFDDTRCALGEGPLWHPERAQLFWFDILGKRLLTREDGRQRRWEFREHVSAAGWIDRDRLLVASETALLTLDLESGERQTLVPLEADNPATRSNDGRADPWGGFWIGTMGKTAGHEAGAIYRFHEGRLTRLFAPVTIPNAISFAPDRSHACFADSARSTIWRVALDGDGWPAGDPEPFLEGGTPDGAVFDAEGCLWNARWGDGAVIRIAPDGTILTRIPVPATQPTCPAIGGARLHVTSATEGLGEDAIASSDAGRTFAIPLGTAGLPEPAVRLP